MAHKITIEPTRDHVVMLHGIQAVYTEKRGSERGKSGKLHPLTTNGDVAQVAGFFDKELRHELMRNLFANDRSASSVTEWAAAKSRIDKHMASADKSARYPDNEWFWGTAALRLAIYLESRKAIPSRTELMIDAVGETVVEHAQTVKNVAKDAVGAVADAGKDFMSTLKTGALILGGLIGAAIVLPPVIRAFRSDPND